MVWVAGFILAIIYAMCGMIRLRRLVSEAVRVRENIYICDAVKSPFILGIVRPRVYLSSSLSEKDMNYIIAHEAAHLKRKDHWWISLGYFILCIYWFNPLCWAAYIMLCKDIELACDEKLAKDMTFLEKKEYAEVLLSCAQQRRMVMVCPLAFGEVGVKERVKSVLKYKRTQLRIIVAAIAGCAVMAVCFLTNLLNKVSGNEVDPSAASDAGKDRSLIQKIAESPCAKFEYCESAEREVFITSEIFLLSSTFSSLDLVESDIPVTEWIYRITFNCAEKFLGDDEIVVLIGDRAMSINGESYTTPENVSFEQVVDLFASKYTYFVNSYFDDQGENRT